MKKSFILNRTHLFSLTIIILHAQYNLFSQSELNSFQSLLDYNERNDFIDKEEIIKSDSRELENLNISKALLLSSSTQFFKIQFYTVLDDYGNGGTTSFETVYENLDYLNTIYEEANVEFVLCDNPLIEIKDTYYSTHGYEVCGLNSMYGNLNEINVFYVDSMYGWAWASAGCCATVLRRVKAANNTSLTHEIGHIFGLSHTFEDNPLLDPELVTRDPLAVPWPANCFTAADGFCDTRADLKAPQWRIDSATCQYTGDSLDANGDLYNPPLDNFMSYGYAHCRTVFSPSQIARISTTAYVSRLQSRLANIVEIVDEPDLNYDVTGEVIIIQNTTVNSNSNISIDACGSVELIGNVEFKLGSVITIN